MPCWMDVAEGRSCWIHQKNHCRVKRRLPELGGSKQNGLDKGRKNSLALGSRSSVTRLSSSSAAGLGLSGADWGFFRGTGQVLDW